MSSILALLRARIKYEGDVSNKFGSMCLSDVGRMLEFTDDEGYTEDVCVGDDVNEDDAVYRFTQEYKLDLTRVENTPAICSRLCSILFKDVFRTTMKFNMNRNTVVEVVDKDSCMVKFAHLDYRAYFTFEDYTLYTESVKGLGPVLDALNDPTLSGNRLVMLRAVPLMCFVTDHKNVWSDCKAFYITDTPYTNGICEVILKNHEACFDAVSKFHSDIGVRAWEDIVVKLEIMCGKVQGISKVMVGKYTLYKIFYNHVITTERSLVFYTYENCETAKAVIEPVYATYMISRSDKELAIDSIETYIKNNHINGLRNILEEVDRLLRLSGVNSGLEVVKDIVEDISK